MNTVEFGGLELVTSPLVMAPRVTSQGLVARAAEHLAGRPGVVVDVGTGSGAIALALATEGPFGRVLATDISLDALAVAKANTRMLSARGALRADVTLLHGALLAPVRARHERANVIVSNPPYIAYDEAAALPADVRDWEPPVALFTGGQGLDLPAQLVREAADALVGGGLLALEVDARRASLIAELVARDTRYRDVAVHLDLAGRERFVLAVRR